MAIYAKVNKGFVEQVIVAEAEFFDNFTDNTPGEWIESSDDGTIRKNRASIGFTYDLDREAFIPPQPYNSWTLNEDTCQWDSPAPYPTDGLDYSWDEPTASWVEITE